MTACTDCRLLYCERCQQGGCTCDHGFPGIHPTHKVKSEGTSGYSPRQGDWSFDRTWCEVCLATASDDPKENFGSLEAPCSGKAPTPMQRLSFLLEGELR